MSTTAQKDPLLGTAIFLIPLGAFLSFEIEPMFGKVLLPAYGGSAEVWTAATTFFQLMLLLGYWMAVQLARYPMSFQARVVFGLALVSIVETWFAPSISLGGFVGIFLSLFLKGGLPLILLFSLSPLLQMWLEKKNLKIPYYLYALSNTGSLCGLACYPFFVERHFSLSEQFFAWRMMFVVTAGLSCLAGILFSKEKSQPLSPAKSFDQPTTGKLFLISVSALATINMLTATGYIAGEIGSTPLTWIGPLAIYLFSFSIIFSGICKAQTKAVCLALLSIAIAGYVLIKGMTPVVVAGSALMWLLAVTAGSSFLGNYLLYERRPAQNSANYYLTLAVGGALGGFLSTAVLPNVLSQPFDFLLSAGALIIISVFSLNPDAKRSVQLALLTAIFAPLVSQVWNQTHQDSPNNRFIHFRNIYGSSRINITDNGTILSNETTTHGSQVTKTPEARRHPTMYYSESSAAGVVIEKLKQRSPSINIGVIGLGAGTLAAYARASDSITFWDVDPKAIYLAKKFFSYLSDCPGGVKIFQEDGRLGLKDSSTQFDVIVVDAFCGDSIPQHLITREALAIYESRLAARHGVLLVHASNRYSILFPTLSSTARSINCTAINIITEIADATPEKDYDHSTTQYIAVTNDANAREVAEWFALEEDQGRVKRKVEVTAPNVEVVSVNPVWTDDSSATLDVLELGRYLRGDP